MKHRKDLLRLLDDVKKDKIDMILVTKLDRWFRNIKDYHITEEILNAHNCHWKTIFESYDSSTANGQMVINIMLSVNQAECDRTSERIKAVFDYKRSQGQVISGMSAPYGYTVIDNHIVKNEEVSHIIEDAYNYYFSCFSRRKVIKYIQEKYRESAPSVYKIDKLFVNEKYCGRFRDDEHFCEPYISKEQFKLIQDITQTKIYAKSAHTYIFSGLLKCPTCGRTMTGRVKKQKLKDGRTSIYPRYVCSSKYDKHASPCISESVVEEYMMHNVLKALEREGIQLQIKAEAASKNATPNADSIRREMDRLNNMYLKGRIKEDFYDSAYNKLESELKVLSGSEVNAAMERYKKIAEKFSGDWLELYRKLDNSHKNAFWKSVVRQISISKDTHKICGFDFLI